MRHSPLVSIILPAYNAEKYIREAINSILAQTLTDFELIILDDGSADNTAKIIKSYTDDRIRYYRNNRNLGVAKSLNIGLEKSRGQYIARMDADDVSVTSRLEVQVGFLKKNPQIDICGSWFKTIGEQSRFIKKYPTGWENIKCELLFGCPIAHPTVMMRRSALQKKRLRYDGAVLHAEDYDLWARASKFLRIDNIPIPLLTRRVGKDNRSLVNAEELNISVNQTLRSQLENLDINPTDGELALHRAVADKNYGRNGVRIKAIFMWLSRIKAQNDKLNVYPKILFRKCIDKYRRELLIKLILSGPTNWAKFITTHRFYPDPVISEGGRVLEINNWVISDFVAHKLTRVVGYKPYPLSELELMVAAVCRLHHGVIFEWGTHLGISARVFYETVRAFGLMIKIHTIDLPANVHHPEHPGRDMGRLIKGLPLILRHRGDGLSVALREIEKMSSAKRFLFFLDGDHQFTSVSRELLGIIKKIPKADILIHDTIDLGPRSGCGNGPHRAVDFILQKYPGRFQKIELVQGRPGMTYLYDSR